MNKKNSKTMRDNPLFMCNTFPVRGKWNIPLIKKQELDTTNLSLIACADTKSNDIDINKKNGIHFFCR